MKIVELHSCWKAKSIASFALAEEQPRGREIDPQPGDRTHCNPQPRLRSREYPERDAERVCAVVHQCPQHHQSDVAQPFGVRRLMADCKDVVSVHQPSPARSSEEGRDSRGVEVRVCADDERLQDAGIYHEADRADHAKAQELIQGSACGGAICR